MKHVHTHARFHAQPHQVIFSRRVRPQSWTEHSHKYSCVRAVRSMWILIQTCALCVPVYIRVSTGEPYVRAVCLRGCACKHGILMRWRSPACIRTCIMCCRQQFRNLQQLGGLFRALLFRAVPSTRPGAGGPSLSPVVSARNWPYSGISTAVTMKLTLRERAGAGETGQGRALGAWMFLTQERAQRKAVPEVCFR